MTGQAPRTQRRPGRPQLERRGDLSGFAFVAFGGAMLVALSAVALLFLSLPPTDEAGGSASPTRVARGSTPPATGSTSAPETASIGPSPSADAPSATATARRSPIVTSNVGQPASITLRGSEVGTVMVLSARRHASIAGQDANRNRQWLVLEVIYQATDGDLPYALSGWSARDDRRTYRPARLPIDTALGNGRLVPGETRRGVVIFSVRRRPVEQVQLAGSDGVPLALFSVE